MHRLYLIRRSLCFFRAYHFYSGFCPVSCSSMLRHRKHCGSSAFQPFFLWLGRTEVCDLDGACHPDGLSIRVADRALSECSEACQAFSRTFGFIQPSHAWLFQICRFLYPQCKCSYYFRSYFVVLMIALLGATPIPKSFCRRLQQRKMGTAVMLFAEPLALSALLLICTAFLVDGSFNPFLYFRF